MNNIEKALWSAIWELEILGATSSDAYAKCKSALSKIGECEPVAYMYQHEETGNIGFIDQWQVDNGFEKNNPRLKIITSLYTSPQPIEKCEPVGWYCKACKETGLSHCSDPENCGGMVRTYTSPISKECEPINEVYAFEKWLKENTLIRASLNIDLDYADPLAEIAYRAWKARAKLNAEKG